MFKNVGPLDRTVRIVVGAILALAGIGGYAGAVPLAWLGIGQALTGVVLVLLGLILRVTGALTACPIYRLFGMSTAR